MKMKKTVLLLTMLIILLISIGSISASDNFTNTDNINSNQIQTNHDTSNNLSTEDSILTNKSTIAESNNEPNIKTEYKLTNNSQSEFDTAVSNNNNTVIYLDNKTFNFNSTSSIIGKNLTIYGGKSLNDGLTSTIIGNYSFDIENSTIRFININFISSITTIKSQYSNISIDNCRIKSNGTGIYGYKENLTVNDSEFKDCYIAIWSTGSSNNTINNCLFGNSSYKILYLSGNNIMNNNTFYNNRGYIDLYVNSTINNSSFKNNKGETIIFSGKLNINNSSFINNTENHYAIIKTNGYSYNQKLNITNSSFINNSGYFGGVICNFESNVNINIDNSTFTNNFGKYGGVIFNDNSYCNITIKNSRFNNNTGAKGGVIFNDNNKTNLDVNNSNFTSNHAFIDGGVAFFEGNNIKINDSNFNNNDATITGGALSLASASNITINNSNFTDNYAGHSGGAITLSYNNNNTITNSIFSNNTASNKTNDIYYYYDAKFNLSNNSNVIIKNGSNDTIIVSLKDIDHIGGSIYRIGNYIGICIEYHLGTLRNKNVTYILLNDTSGVINSLNGNLVNEYIKYVIYEYYGNVSIGLMNKLIWTFSDFNYNDTVNLRSLYYSLYGPDSEEECQQYLQIMNDTLTKVNNGFRLPDINGTKSNGSDIIELYIFKTLFSNTYQDFILFNISEINASGIYDMDVVKISNNKSVIKGEDVSFDIVVRNNGTLMLSNVTIVEDNYSDLIYKSWTPINGEWEYTTVNGKPAWRLINMLGVNEAVSILVNFSTENATPGGKINSVIVTSNNTNKTTNNTTTVNYYNFTVIKETLTPVVYKGDKTSFRIIVTNTGSLRLTNITVREISFDDLTYNSWKSVNGNWTYNNDLSWTIQQLEPGESASFDITFNTDKSKIGNKINTIIVSTNENGTKNTTNNTKIIENNTNKTENNKTINNNKTTNKEEERYKAEIKTTEGTGYPIIMLILALIAICGSKIRKR